MRGTAPPSVREATTSRPRRKSAAGAHVVTANPPSSAAMVTNTAAAGPSRSRTGERRRAARVSWAVLRAADTAAILGVGAPATRGDEVAIRHDRRYSFAGERRG